MPVIALIILGLWLLIGVGSLIDHIWWRVGLITYPETWAFIIVLNLIIWPWRLYDTYLKHDPPEVSG